jgi:integrase
MGLSEFTIKNAKPRDKPYKIFDSSGLYLLVSIGGGKRWQQKYRFFGKEKTLSHGRYPEVGLAKARQLRDTARAMVADGTHPSVQKKLAHINAQIAHRTTFKLIAEEYIENSEVRGLAASTMRKKRWFLLDLAKPIHDRPVSEVTPAEVLYLLKAIEKSGRRETAKKMRSTLSAVFRLAIMTLRAHNDPTSALKGALVAPKVIGRAAITDEKLFGALLRSFEEYSGWPVIISAMKFQILTMTRPTEARGAQKREFDLARKTWTIPADRMKMRREHVVPLSKQALKIVEANWPAIEGMQLLFPSLVSSKKWLSENAFNSALRRMGYAKEEVTAHGFRVTASTILNTRGHDPDVIEAALAHQDPNTMRRTYNRSTYFDQRVKLMQDWADLIDGFRKAR